MERDQQNEYSTADLLQEALDGKRDFWVVFGIDGGLKIKAVLSTYTIGTPRKKIFFCHLVCGDNYAEWADEVIRAFVREAAYANCDSIQMNARRGIVKAMWKFGFEELSITCERRITDEDRNNGRKQTNNQPVGVVEHERLDERVN